MTRGYATSKMALLVPLFRVICELRLQKRKEKRALLREEARRSIGRGGYVLPLNGLCFRDGEFPNSVVRSLFLKVQRTAAALTDEEAPGEGNGEARTATCEMAHGSTFTFSIKKCQSRYTRMA